MMRKLKNLNLLFIVTILVGGSFLLLSMTSIAPKPWQVPAKYKTMKNTKAADKDAAGVAKALYKQHCASCHGAKGAGDGKKAAELDSEIRDFGTAAFQAQTDGEIYYKSFIGRDEMPNFEKKVTSEADRWLLVNYMRTMKK